MLRARCGDVTGELQVWVQGRVLRLAGQTPRDVEAMPGSQTAWEDGNLTGTPGAGEHSRVAGASRRAEGLASAPAEGDYGGHSIFNPNNTRVQS